MFRRSGGTPIRYGQPEPWKAIKLQIGRTKSSRASQPGKSRGKNDGRPPDTSKELLSKKGKSSQKGKSAQIPPSNEQPVLNSHPSYPWRANSCWLDTSLELLFIAVTRDFQDFVKRFQGGRDNTTLWIIRELFELRLQMETSGGTQDPVKELGFHRDIVRTHLLDRGIIKQDNTFQGLFVRAMFYSDASILTCFV